MRKPILLGTLMWLSACAVAPVPAPGAPTPAHQADGPGAEVIEPAGEMIASGSEWELTVEYRNKGSRSEGQHGTLVRDGKRLDDGNVGDLLDTPLGTMRYYGTQPERPWSTTGWHFADAERMSPSWADRER